MNEKYCSFNRHSVSSTALKVPEQIRFVIQKVRKIISDSLEGEDPLANTNTNNIKKIENFKDEIRMTCENIKHLANK